jgi:hypothetical protein
MNLDSILGTAKDYIQKEVGKNANVPKAQSSVVSDVIFGAVSKSLTSQLGGSSKSGGGIDLSKLGGLLGGGSSSGSGGLLGGLLGGGSSSGSSSLLDTLSKSVVDALMKKAGMKSGVAQSIVSAILPGLISNLTKNIGGGNLGNVAGGLLGGLLGGKK